MHSASRRRWDGKRPSDRDRTRKERYDKAGFYLNDTHVWFPIVTPQEQVEPATCHHGDEKYQLEEAIVSISRHVGPNTMILSLLNGIESEYRIAEVYGEEHVLWGFVTRLNSVHEGNRITFVEDGIIIFGEKDNTRTPRIEMLEALFEQAGIACKISQEIIMKCGGSSCSILDTTRCRRSAGRHTGTATRFLRSRSAWRWCSTRWSRWLPQSRSISHRKTSTESMRRWRHRVRGKDLDAPGYGSGQTDGEQLVLRYGIKIRTETRHPYSDQ